jgi:hypothetical protein
MIVLSLFCTICAKDYSKKKNIYKYRYIARLFKEQEELIQNETQFQNVSISIFMFLFVMVAMSGEYG